MAGAPEGGAGTPAEARQPGPLRGRAAVLGGAAAGPVRRARALGRRVRRAAAARAEALGLLRRGGAGGLPGTPGEWRGVQLALASVAAGLAPRVPAAAKRPREGSYGLAALKRRFNDLDLDRSGSVTELELKAAIKKLQLPASEESIQTFIKEVSGRDGPPHSISFSEFCNFAIAREQELLQTFNEMDQDGYGFLTDKQLRKAMNKMGYRNMSNGDIRKILKTIKTGSGPFSKGGGLLGASNAEFQAQGRAIDFAEFRDFLMLSSASDMRGVFEVWGRAVLDLGDVDVSFPLSSGKHRKQAGKHVERSGMDVFKHLMVGAISGGVSRSVVAPLERVKVMYMADSSLARTEGMAGTLARIVRTDGPMGLFKGNSLNVARIAPTKAVEFFVFDKFKDFCLESTGEIDMTGWQRALGGSLASMAGTALTHPIDTVRTRVSVQGLPVKTIVDQLMRDEGPKAFLRGLGPNMVRVAPYGAINFYVYDYLKSWYRRRVGPGGSLGALPSMLFGAAAGAAAQTVVFPIEMIQRRLQAQGMAGSPVLYKNMVDAAVKIVRKEGLRALYAGLVPNYGKLIPAAAISFWMYELLKQQFDLN